MLESEARAKLEDLTAASIFPALDPDVVTRALRDSRREDIFGRLPSEDIEWAPSTVYLVDDVIVPTVRNGHAYRVTVGGLSGADEPIWPTVAGDTITADGVTYAEDASQDYWDGYYDLNRAAAALWRIKAGNVSNRHTFGSNQGNYNPEQVFDHCMKMAEHYANRVVASIVLESGRWDGTGRINAAHLEDAV